jgi:two-component system chemotaxis response regulator CheY
MPLQATNVIKNDQRYKLAKLQVLLADGDHRTAQLVKTILVSFGIRKVDVVYNAEEALQALRTRRVDLLITERDLRSSSGMDLVRMIRSSKADKLLRFGMPIIMLTAHSEVDEVRAARDAGITEFIAKPFSARTISSRLIEIIDNPRVFVEAPNYTGPSRRRRGAPPPGIEDRRAARERQIASKDSPKVTITRADRTLLEMINITHAADIFTDEVITEAQTELLKAEEEFVVWVKDDIMRLEAAYSKLFEDTTSSDARKNLLAVAYTIKSQAGIFGYDLGTLVADMLITYISEHSSFGEHQLMVVRKHIDTVEVIFTQKVKESGGHVGHALIDSLNKLVTKFS